MLLMRDTNLLCTKIAEADSHCITLEGDLHFITKACAFINRELETKELPFGIVSTKILGKNQVQFRIGPNLPLVVSPDFYSMANVFMDVVKQSNGEDGLWYEFEHEGGDQWRAIKLKRKPVART
jgi:hypothetical protein